MRKFETTRVSEEIMLRWILKKFWFPIVLIVLKMLRKKYPWAGKTYNAITKVATPIKTVKSTVKK